MHNYSQGNNYGIFNNNINGILSFAKEKELEKEVGVVKSKVHNNNK